MTLGTLGYLSAMSGHRVTAPVHVFAILIVCVAYLIIDVDRLRRGAIQVSHRSMLDLQTSMGAGAQKGGK